MAANPNQNYAVYIKLNTYLFNLSPPIVIISFTLDPIAMKLWWVVCEGLGNYKEQARFGEWGAVYYDCPILNPLTLNGDKKKTVSFEIKFVVGDEMSCKIVSIYMFYF